MPESIHNFDGFRFADLDGRGFAYIGHFPDEQGTLKHWFTTSEQTPLLDLRSQKHTYDEASQILARLRASTGDAWQLPHLPLLVRLMERAIHSPLREDFDTSRLGWVLSSTFDRGTSPNGNVKYPDLVATSRAKDACVSYVHRSLVRTEIRPVFPI